METFSLPVKSKLKIGKLGIFKNNFTYKDTSSSTMQAARRAASYVAGRRRVGHGPGDRRRADEPESATTQKVTNQNKAQVELT